MIIGVQIYLSETIIVLRKRRGFRYIMVVFDNFGRTGWTGALKNKTSQVIKDSFEHFRNSFKRKPHLFETDDGKKLINKFFTNYLNTNNITDFLAIHHEELFLQKSLKELSEIFLKKPVPVKGDALGLMYNP